MINPQVAIPLVAAIAMGAGVVYRWMEHRERMARIAADANRPPADDERLLRLEQAIESIALETERIGEGQRYVTRLLAERPSHQEPLPRGSVEGPGRSITPH